MYSMNIVYRSSCLLIIEDYGLDRFYIINLDDYGIGLLQNKIKVINTFTCGLTNADIEESIEEVLHNGGYDIEEEIEIYRNSELYNMLVCNDEE